MSWVHCILVGFGCAIGLCVLLTLGWYLCYLIVKFWKWVLSDDWLSVPAAILTMVFIELVVIFTFLCKGMLE
jgi:hypothetical protein